MAGRDADRQQAAGRQHQVNKQKSEQTAGMKADRLQGMWRQEKDEQLTDVTPEIKIISFGVRELKKRRVTPNGEEIKDEKRNFLGVFLIVQALTRYQRNSGRREMPYNEKELSKSYRSTAGGLKKKEFVLVSSWLWYTSI